MTWREALRARARFNRQELSGAFGDIGTDLPLIVGMVYAARLDSASVLVMFGLMQVVTGLAYGLPMPVQPLKAMAVLVITQRLGGEVLFGAGLAIGAVMLALSVTGALDWLGRIVPLSAVRGIQFGLGLSLASLALKQYVPSLGMEGYALAAAGFVLILAISGSSRFPAGLAVILLGVGYAALTRLEYGAIASGAGLALPKFHAPRLEDVLTGFLVLALPQIPLSLSNSLIATRQIVADLFPGREMSLRRIGATYSAMNLIAPFLSGLPVCHGCGGLAGHHYFGARTGGSVVIYGSMYLLLGLFLSGAFRQVVEIFPQPILGVVLAFEALALMLFIRDQAGSRRDLGIALLTGLCAFGLPYGFVAGTVIGTALHYASERWPGRGRLHL